jgi:hypothetical protein
MPEESATMLGKLEGMPIDINKAWLRLMFFFRDIENKSFVFLPVNNDDEYSSFQI